MPVERSPAIRRNIYEVFVPPGLVLVAASSARAQLQEGHEVFNSLSILNLANAHFKDSTIITITGTSNTQFDNGPISKQLPSEKETMRREDEAMIFDSRSGSKSRRRCKMEPS